MFRHNNPRVLKLRVLIRIDGQVAKHIVWLVLIAMAHLGILPVDGPLLYNNIGRQHV